MTQLISISKPSSSGIRWAIHVCVCVCVCPLIDLSTFGLLTLWVYARNTFDVQKNVKKAHLVWHKHACIYGYFFVVHVPLDICFRGCFHLKTCFAIFPRMSSFDSWIVWIFLKEFMVSICQILIAPLSRKYRCELTIPLETGAFLLFFLFEMMIRVKV